MFIDSHRDRFGVEPISKVLQVAPSAYRRHAARQRRPALRSARALGDESMLAKIERVWHVNRQVNGVEKVWRQLKREGIAVARCTVERLMRQRGLAGVMKGKKVRTTYADVAAPCPRDCVNRQFVAERPNQLWVSDFTYVSSWQGFVYVAFVIDVYSRFIVGWRVSRSMQTDFVLDALEQALYARQPDPNSLIHHSITVTAACSTCQFATPSIWQRPVLSHRSAARATATTTRWQKPLTVCIKPRGFIAEGRGERQRLSKSRHSMGGLV